MPLAPPLRRPPARAGFSLIELLIVIAVIAVVSAIAIPRLNVSRYRVNAATRSSASTLAYAQRQAVSFQHDMRVVFRTDLGLLEIHEDKDNDGVAETGERVTRSELGEGVRFGRGTAAVMAELGTGPVAFDARSGEFPLLVFHRDGSASENGGFYLISHRGAADARYADDARAVGVVRASGRPAWFAYDGSTWKRGN